MISKTKINKRMKKKTNPELAEAIFISKKENMLDLADALSVPTRKQAKVNLEQINKSEKDNVVIPGKVLGLGEINKKKKIYALGFSRLAKEKIEKAGCEAKLIIDALRRGEKINGEILR